MQTRAGKVEVALHIITQIVSKAGKTSTQVFSVQYIILRGAVVEASSRY